MALSIKEGLVECVTECVKGKVILQNSDIGILVQKGFKPIVIMMGFTSLLSSLTTGFPLPVFVNEWRERKLLLNFFFVQGSRFPDKMIKGGVRARDIHIECSKQFK